MAVVIGMIWAYKKAGRRAEERATRRLHPVVFERVNSVVIERPPKSTMTPQAALSAELTHIYSHTPGATPSQVRQAVVEKDIESLLNSASESQDSPRSTGDPSGV
ncbi:MAG: hypothetical protein KVP17_001342 [Porospora cf. gigantea B]|uniref:uncharacterized protein n=1 Tax=Porospora cf. gigantea B TaxID=2853592 RepID=UPI003571E80D|nr:MAG: hypothetical protein KVP17_001342 [Porospora cf. gigantea B]